MLIVEKQLLKKETIPGSVLPDPAPIAQMCPQCPLLCMVPYVQGPHYPEMCVILPLP